MTKRILLGCCIAIITISIFDGCSPKYDAETVSDVSILQEGQDQYDLTFLQIADMLDEYAYVKGERVKRGTQKYVDFLNETALNDSELKTLPEWNAIRIYISQYGGVTGDINNLDLDDNDIPEGMSGQTIKEYAEERGLSPEDYLYGKNN